MPSTSTCQGLALASMPAIATAAGMTQEGSMGMSTIIASLGAAFLVYSLLPRKRYILPFEPIS